MINQQDPHVGQQILWAGTALAEAQAAMILVHGRGATAQSILELSGPLHHPHMAYLAPQAAGNSWYPQSFLAPMESNEPWLASALKSIANIQQQLQDAGIPDERILFCGFSQGACLASEYVARNATRYGGLLIFSGGLIGPPNTPRDYAGDLQGTPIFIGCSDVDFHIPVERVHETADVLTALGGTVDKQIYSGMGHTIIQAEIDRARKIIEELN
jgi:predicted esterase